MKNVQNKLNDLKDKVKNFDRPLIDVFSDIIEILEEIHTYLLHPETTLLRSMSLREFLKKVKAKTHTTRIISMAYYLYVYRNIDPFNVKDLEQMYEEARIPLPENLNDFINKYTKKGFFIECKKKKNGLKAWKISEKGIEYVESLIKGDKRL